MSDSKSSPAAAAPRRANLWSLLTAAVVCVTVVVLVREYHHHAEPPPPQRLWTPVVMTVEGGDTDLQPATRRLEFWTPSARTKDFSARDGGVVRPRDKWEVLPSDESVIQFGAMLRTNIHVLGYRRTEVWGHGSTQLKPGWWWTMTVNTNYTPRDLNLAYRAFWKSSNSLRVEVIENPGAN